MDETQNSAANSVVDVASALANVLTQNPFIALIAIALAIAIVILLPAAATSKHKGMRIFLYAFGALIIFIIGSGWFLIIFPQNTDLHSATLRVRLNDTGNASEQNVRASSKANSESGSIYSRYHQNEANLSSWRHDLLLQGKPETLHLNIYGRQVMECDAIGDSNALSDEFETASDAGAEQSASKTANTFFEVDLSEAYLPGQAFDIDFEYQDNLNFDIDDDTLVRADKLFLTKAKGIDVEKITVIATHTETLNCKRDRSPNRYFEVRQGSLGSNTEHAWLSFFQPAFAGNESPEKQREFIEVLTKENSGYDTLRLNDYLSSNPKEAAGLSAEVLGDPSVGDETKLGYLNSLLTIPVSERPKSAALLQSLVPLVAHDNFEIRRSAARLLRAPEYADETVIQALHRYIETNKEKLANSRIPGRDYSALYLVAAAGRDIYYNYGISIMNEMIDNAGVQTDDSLQASASLARRAFTGGKNLAKYAPEDRKILFSKLDYGAALVNYTAASISWANAQPSPDGNIQALLSSAQEQGFELPSGTPYVKETLQSFETFLGEVETAPSKYSWPHHVVQAQQCLASDNVLPTGCLVIK
jgi:hypothetical protein